MLMLQVDNLLVFPVKPCVCDSAACFHIGSFYPIPWFIFFRSWCTQGMAVLLPLSGRVFWCLFGAL